MDEAKKKEMIESIRKRAAEAVSAAVGAMAERYREQDEKSAEIERLQAEVDRLKSEVKRLRKRLKKPAAK